MPNHMDMPLKTLRSNQRFKGDNKYENTPNSSRFSKSFLVKSLSTNISSINKTLAIAAMQLATDCYSLDKTSEKLIRSFIIAIERIRSEYDALP